MKSITRLAFFVGAVVTALLPHAINAQNLILNNIERITDTGIDSSGIRDSSTNYRKYRRDVNLVGTINGAAASTSNNFSSGIVDRSDAIFSGPSTINGSNFITIYMVGYTSALTLTNVSGKLIISEASYEAQRLASPAVILVFPRSTQTYSINGEPYVIVTPTPNPPGSAKWTNLSTRVFAGTGDNSLIVGFVVAGTIPKNYLVRVVGPSLGQFGLTSFMADPKFQLFAQGVSAPVAQNDDWGGSQSMVATFASVGAFGMTSPASKDSALVVTLAPGAYSVVVNATSTNSGVALVEVYEVP